MRNWSSIEELERGTRNSFLINRKPTEIEIYRTKGLLIEIEKTAATIEVLEGLRFSGSNYAALRQIKEEIEYLFIIYESLREMIRENASLQFLFVFDIAKIGGTIRRILERVDSLSPYGSDACLKTRP